MILKRFNVTRSTDDPLTIERLKAEGYVPIKDKAALPPKEKPDYRKMTKAELVAAAQEKGITGAKSFNKAELIAVLEELI